MAVLVTSLTYMHLRPEYPLALQAAHPSLLPFLLLRSQPQAQRRSQQTCWIDALAAQEVSLEDGYLARDSEM